MMIARPKVFMAVLMMIGLMSVCLDAMGDELVLVNGRIATGTVENPDGDPIYLKSPKGRIAYSRSEISVIHYGAVNTPVVAPADLNAETSNKTDGPMEFDDDAARRVKRLLVSLDADLDEEEEVGLAEERKRIVEMIVAYGAPASQLLADKFDSAQVQSAPYILSALATVNPKEATSLAVKVMSANSSSSLRSAAITALADLDPHAHAPAFRSALQDPQGEVRAAAASALGETKNEAEAETLITLVSDVSPMVRKHAMNALEQCVGKKHKTPEEWLAWWESTQKADGDSTEDSQ